MCEVRRGCEADLEAIAAIQAASPEASHWPVADYLSGDLLVAIRDGKVVGFLAARRLGDLESEILNLAVQPEQRRKGIARRLLSAWREAAPGPIFLEVRESNRAARALYQTFGFHEVSVRKQYYESPPEAAIVLKFHSC